MGDDARGFVSPSYLLFVIFSSCNSKPCCIFSESNIFIQFVSDTFEGPNPTF